MSILKLSTSALSIVPHVVVGQNWLTARTHRLWSLLSLLSYRRELWVDQNQRRLRLRERRWWRALETEIAVDAIDHIEYQYKGFATSFFFAPHAGRLGAQAADGIDRYVVRLVLKNGDRLPLFTFIGEGARMTGAVGALLGDGWLDAEGKQEEEARGFVQQLMRLTKLGLGPSLPRQVAERRGTRCPRCSQLNAPRVRCLYCGAALEAAPGPVAPES